MGQIIAFPVPPSAYPDLTADLDPAESVLLLAIRWWVESYRSGDDPVPRLCRGLEAAGLADAAFPIDGLMMVLARTVTRPVAIHCPKCPQVSPDETHLLRAVGLAQADEGLLAEKVLRTTLLSAQGAEFALGPLEGVGELFARARLLLSARRLPADEQAAGDARNPGSPPRWLN